MLVDVIMLYIFLCTICSICVYSFNRCHFVENFSMSGMRMRVCVCVCVCVCALTEQVQSVQPRLSPVITMSYQVIITSS